MRGLGKVRWQEMWQRWQSLILICHLVTGVAFDSSENLNLVWQVFALTYSVESLVPILMTQVFIPIHPGTQWWSTHWTNHHHSQRHFLLFLIHILVTNIWFLFSPESLSSTFLLPINDQNIRLTPFLLQNVQICQFSSRNIKMWHFFCKNLNKRFKPAMIPTQVYASLWKATSAGKSLNHIRIFLLAWDVAGF